MSPMYKSELSLVNRLIAQLRATSHWGALEIRREFQYEGGRADVIACSPNGQLLAFEAKLSKWRDALTQAYRASFFANRSYVVLPEATARVAKRYAAEFQQRNVGLCYLRGSELVVALEPDKRLPLQSWIHRSAFEMIRGRNGKRRSSGGRRQSVLRSKPIRVR